MQWNPTAPLSFLARAAHSAWSYPLSTLIKILIAFFLPPISVLMTNGIGLQFLFNILLCLLFYIPGSLHALYLLLRDR